MNIRTVLCPLDFTDLSRRELQLAVDVARRFSARLVLEHNLDPAPPGGMAVSWMWRGEHVGHGAASEAEAENRLLAIMAELPADVRCEARLTRGPVDATLAGLTGTLPADLLVMGSHGWSRPEHLSVTERVLSLATCPVLTLGEETEPCLVPAPAAGGETGFDQPALIVADPSARGRRTLEFGLELCRHLSLRPVVLHVEDRGLLRRGGSTTDLVRQRRRLERLLPAAWRGKCECLPACGERAAVTLETAARQQAACLVLPHGEPRRLLRRPGRPDVACAILHGSRRPVWFLPAAARAGAWRETAA